MKLVNIPPTISSTQKTYSTISISQIPLQRLFTHTHLQLACSAMNPPQIGPRTGPNRGPNEKMAMASPRCCFSKRSAIIPAPMVKQPEPPIPVKNRNTMRDWIFLDNAQPIWKHTKNVVAALRMILRPNISLIGERNIGPIYVVSKVKSLT